jgi:hypothetical protein
MYSIIPTFVIASVAAAAPVVAQPCKWSALERGPDEFVYALAPFDDGSGPALYVGGGFQAAGGQLAFSVARWDGEAWSAVGPGFRDGLVFSLAVFDDGRGEGPALYAGGSFETSGGKPVRGIAKWDGASWSEVGGGIAGGATKPAARALCVFDDGSGPALYAGGSFGSVGGEPGTSFIAKWDGESWSPLGTGVGSYVRAFAVLDDGAGAALYVAGYLKSAGGIPANHVAKWDGESWSPLGEGTDRYINALAAFDGGSGPALYAGGTFFLAGGEPASYIAKWDGQSWMEVGGGVNHVVSAANLVGEGVGSALYVGGGFTMAGDTPVDGIARWDGRSWSAIEATGLEPEGGLEFIMFDDGRGPALHVAGVFYTSAGLREYIARLDCASCPADCDGSGDLTFFDFLCFQNLFAALDPGADCDGDGELTFFDFLCFQNAFAAGCP